MDIDRQQSYRCPLVGEPSRWSRPGEHPIRYMGLTLREDEPLQCEDHRRAHECDDLDYGEPFESNADGCPGAWYRTPFFWSVFRYVRPEADGVYSPNTLLDRCDDDLIHEAVRCYEQERGRWKVWKERIVTEHRDHVALHRRNSGGG